MRNIAILGFMIALVSFVTGGLILLWLANDNLSITGAVVTVVIAFTCFFTMMSVLIDNVKSLINN